jgi:dolichol-phosphate mannosyltransferase
VPRTVVVIPTYNEAENLPVLVERLGVEAPDVDILCVDDASPDGTGFVADRIAAESSRFHVLHRAGARGYARASRDGLSWALDRGYDLVCTMDADLSHDPATLPALLAASDPGADLVIGSRYVPGGEIVVDWGPVRWAVSRMGSAYARTMIGCPVNDCTSGFRCYRAAALAEVPFADLGSEGYSFLIQLLALLGERGSRIVEVPIRYVDRRAGASKISRAIVLEAFVVATWIGTRRLLGLKRTS